jgi:GTPase SAR1 family protein
MLSAGSKRIKPSIGNYLIVGDADVGKSALANILSGNSTSTTDNIIDFSYISCEGISEEMSDMQSHTQIQEMNKINLWMIKNEIIYSKLINSLLNMINTSRLGIIICVDSSKEDNSSVTSLKKWLSIIKNTNFQSSLILNYGNNVTTKFINIPIIVVGCKCDQLTSALTSSTDVLVIKRLKEIQGILRVICLEYGISLVYTSVTKNCNVSSLRRLMLLSLYNEMPSLQSHYHIDDSLDSLFLPAGTDTIELINIKTGYNMSTDPSLHTVDLTVVESNLAMKSTSSNSNLNNISGATESDSEWINSLVAFVNQVTASSTTTSSTTTSVNATGVSENVDTKPTTKVKSKRINVADTATEDASDFFKNLLAGGKK